MAETIYWYDYETSGLDPALDRPIQFAGLRTDHALRPVGEPTTLYCALSDDVLPAPEAMLVSGISLATLASEGLSESKFIGRINRDFSAPGTCVAGFNNIRFDDEFTRNALYRNLFDPYAREWQGGNSRWDVIDLFRTAHALRPEGMEWPTDDRGVPSFRLEELARANGITHRMAHDALSDVEATLALASRQRVCQPRLYDYLFNLRHKRAVLDQLYPLGKRMVVHVSGMYPAAAGCIAIVLPLCTHPSNSNGVIVYDLSVDPGPLLDLPAEEVHRLLFSSADELAEGETRIPLKTLHINRSPSVAPLATLTDEVCDRFALDRVLCQAHMEQIQHAAGVVEKVQEAVTLTQFPPHEDPDRMLYEGDFFSTRDRERMVQLHATPPEGMRALEEGFDDARLPEMIFRFRARNFPETLTDEERSRWRRFCRERWGGREGLTAYRERLARLRTECVDSSRDLAILDELAAHADGLTRLLDTT